MRKIFGLVLVMVVLASVVPLAVTPAAAYEWKIPCDDGDNELTKAELVNAILPYMLEEEGVHTLDNVGDAAYIYAYWDGKPKTVGDSPKETTLYKPVERLIPLPVGLIANLRSVGAKDKIVGVNWRLKDCPVFFGELADLPNIGEVSSPDYEAILNLKPDAAMLPFGSRMGYDQAADKLESLGVSVIRLKAPKCCGSDFTDPVKALGYALDKEDEAEKFCDWHDGYLNEVIAQTEGLSEDEKPTVFYSYPAYVPQIYYSINRLSGTHNALVAAGGINIAADYGTSGSPMISEEWLINQSPEVIIGTTTMGLVGPKNCWGDNACYEFDDITVFITARETYMNTLSERLGPIQAIESERVYFGCVFGTPTLDLVYMAKWLHPDLFDDLDLKAIHQEYLDRFQRIDFNVYEHGVFAYPPL